MSKKLTPWFPADVKPVHIGVYQTDYVPYEPNAGYSWWDGKEWGHQHYSKERAYIKKAKVGGGRQDKKWRGLAEKP